MGGDFCKVKRVIVSLRSIIQLFQFEVPYLIAICHIYTNLFERICSYSLFLTSIESFFSPICSITSPASVKVYGSNS